MSYIIPPPIKIEFPEQIALSNSIGGSRSDVAASELAVKLLADQMRALGTTNLLINPRGKINQANETDGVIAAGDYFCDGWKAGSNGAHVYRLDDGGFDLQSGSIVQLIPNDLEASRLVRTNLDVVSGSPMMKVNGTAEKAAAGDGEYIEIEISGDESSFNCLIAAVGATRPIYQQLSDELSPCFRFLRFFGGRLHRYLQANFYSVHNEHLNQFHKPPAATWTGISAGTAIVGTPYGFQWGNVSSHQTSGFLVDNLKLDARP